MNWMFTRNRFTAGECQNQDLPDLWIIRISAALL